MQLLESPASVLITRSSLSGSFVLLQCSSQ